MLLTLSGIASVAIILIITGFTPLKKYTDGFQIIIIIFFASLALNSYLTQLAKGREKVLDMGIAGIIGTAVSLTANIIFLLVLKMGLKGFFYAGILGSAIPDIYYSIRLRDSGFFRFKSINKKYIKEMTDYSVPLILVVIGWAVNSNFDKYVVTAFSGLAANGLLAVAYKVPNILNAVQGIFTQAWQISAISEFKNEDSGDFYSKVFNYSLSFSSVLCAVLIVLTRPIASILYSKDFYEAWRFVPFLLISFLLNFAAGLIGPILSAKMDSKTMAKSAVGGILINVILNCVLIKSIGIQGVTIATAISSLCIYLIRKISIREIINSKDTFSFYISLIMLSALATAEIIMQNYIIEIILLIIIVVCNYKQIGEMINKAINILKEKYNENSSACSDKA